MAFGPLPKAFCSCCPLSGSRLMGRACLGSRFALLHPSCQLFGACTLGGMLKHLRAVAGADQSAKTSECVGDTVAFQLSIPSAVVERLH